MSAGIVVRAVGPDDWQEWRDVRLAALADAPFAFLSTLEHEQDRTEDDWRGWLGPERGFHALAYEDGAPAGIAGAYLKDEDGVRTSELFAMWVAPSHRGRGVGEALIDRAGVWTVTQEVAELHLYVAADNPVAERFYTRIGFTRTGFQQAFPNDPTRLEIAMSRPIAAASTCTLTVAWDPALTAYDFGPTHPMSPVRVDLTMRLAGELGLLERAGVSSVKPDAADDAMLQLVHDADYIAAVRRVSADPDLVDFARGLGTPDNPVFAGMHDATARVVGATVAAARAVWTGATQHGVNITGGLHHAMPAACSGFCVYNDPAIAIAWLLDQGAERVAYIDVDVHHGDGVQAIFYDDPRVLTISLHESPRTLFPGTGYAEEVGGPNALGSAVNVALPGGTADAGWLRAFHAVVPPLLAEFAPDVLVSQHGCDSHADDPLANLALTVDGQRAAYIAIHDLAHTHAQGRWVATGGGGYAVVDVVPRAWTHLIAIGSGAPLDPNTPVPAGWRSHVLTALGRRGPARMTDGADGSYRPFEDGYNPADPLDRAIMATRASVFRHHGIDPALVS